MIYLKIFLFTGLVCLVAEMIVEFTKLTPGHVNALFTVIGAILGFFNLYDYLILEFDLGAITLITNFGASLFNGAKIGFLNDGFIGIFSGMLKEASTILTVTIISSFLVALIFKPKN